MYQNPKTKSIVLQVYCNPKDPIEKKIIKKLLAEQNKYSDMSNCLKYIIKKYYDIS